MKIVRKNRRVAAAFLLGLLLSLEVLVVFPALHAWVHPDAKGPDHDCAVTLFSHGQVSAAGGAPSVFRAPLQIVFSRPIPKVIFVSADVRLLPGRGPPAFATLG